MAVTSADNLARTARVLHAHGLSLAEHYVMCSAGYRVTLPPDAFLAHAFSASEGDPRGNASFAELTAALDRLEARGLMSRLTETALQEEARRRATSDIPELIDTGYQVGHVDFTPRGYAVHRTVIREIHGDALVDRSDAGFNLDSDAGWFDVYAVTAETCRDLMETIEAGGDSYTGTEGTRFVGRNGPTAIAQWRPNRFVVREAGFHGVLRFRSDAHRP
jgi:hypothetical protein